ncbi:DUF456 domain-containing protein [Egicoccus halophilus]|uniref:DUF456 domain-containing protein n=1 Tax=Egicoccus halophilus TaxID=1670830 RepID=A0A8J3ADD4_9ACTN|nr:DUF456 domain-containing protein [Egicoccus halophilus]GGI09773.1 hypothetical protein GCM10011354_35740 [Egicoccus halophilus]
MDPVVAALALLVMLVGLVGVVVPVLPGLLLVWLAGAGSALLVATDTAGWTIAAILTVLFAIGTGATIWLPARSGRRGGVPMRSLGLAALGAVVGFFVIPVLGFLIGAAAGLLVAEFQRLGDWEPAWRSVGSVVRAYGIGVVVELVVGLTMIAVWGVAAFVR